MKKKKREKKKKAEMREDKKKTDESGGQSKGRPVGWLQQEREGKKNMNSETYTHKVSLDGLIAN